MMRVENQRKIVISNFKTERFRYIYLGLSYLVKKEIKYMIDIELKKKILRAVIKEGRKMTGQRFTYNGKKYYVDVVHQIVKEV